MKKQVRKFTLIELLVVVAIIAVLAGMLLPTLNKARETAKTISCLNKVKQISQQLFHYMTDNHDYFPGPYVSLAAGDFTFLRKIALENGIKLPDPGDGYASQMNFANNLYRCPNVEDKEYIYSYTPYTSRITYGVNYYISKSDLNPVKLWKIATVCKTSSLMLTIEARGHNSVSTDDTGLMAVRFSHEQNNVTNMAFCDGHTEKRKK